MSCVLQKLSGIFDVKIYPTEYSIQNLMVSSQAYESSKSMGEHNIDVSKLNRLLNEIDYKAIRKRATIYSRLYYEALVSQEPGKGISFTNMLLMLAHHKLIDDREALTYVPSSLQTTISSVQKGVFIPSVVICFVLWCYAILCLFLLSRRDSRSIGCINRVLIILLALIAFLFCLATFVAQMIVYNLLQSGVQSLMTGSFGSLIDNLVVLTTERGRSIWLSLAAFIALFIAFILICITSCPCGRRRKRGTEDAYEMSRV